MKAAATKVGEIFFLSCAVPNLQDLAAVFDPLLQPSVQDVFGRSEAGSVIQCGEETHADGAGQQGRGGCPAASLVKGLERDEKNEIKCAEKLKTNKNKIIPTTSSRHSAATCMEWCRLSCRYGVEADGVGGLW